MSIQAGFRRIHFSHTFFSGGSLYDKLHRGAIPVGLTTPKGCAPPCVCVLPLLMQGHCVPPTQLRRRDVANGARPTLLALQGHRASRLQVRPRALRWADSSLTCPSALAGRSLNVLVDEDVRVAKVADFGLSRIRQEHSQTSTFAQAGTLLWMAPEVRKRQLATSPPVCAAYSRCQGLRPRQKKRPPRRRLCVWNDVL